MPDNQPNLADTLRSVLPEALRDEPAVSDALQQVASLETEHAQTLKRADGERRFLERAPREGLLYPGDALKLEDVSKSLESDDGLDRLYRELKAKRPYLFAKPQAPEKLATRQPENEGIRQAWKGGLTRQVQIARDAMKRR
jgi:hypothetical protein